MICQWCGKSFPKRKGRFCGGCYPPAKQRIDDALRDGAAIIGCLLTWADESDEAECLKNSVGPIWDIIEHARQWENRYAGTIHANDKDERRA